jgi:hypothetical protein
MNIPNHISESLKTNFVGGSKIVKFSESGIFLSLDPGPGMEKSDSGSGINIPDPQHWCHEMTIVGDPYPQHWSDSILVSFDRMKSEGRQMNQC